LPKINFKADTNFGNVVKADASMPSRVDEMNQSKRSFREMRESRSNRKKFAESI